jgi:putative glutamine amidotransferase
MPPIIAITAPLRTDDGVARVRLGLAYARAVERAGALPVIVPPLTTNESAARILDAADGLLLTGGEDVDPALYGAARHPSVTDVSTERDATELALLAAARERGKPVLAICRGIQLMNVAFGGTLIQDIPTQHPGALAHDQADASERRVHDVAVEPGSHLAEALGVAALKVNSFHHQAAGRVADRLRATAWSPDGIVEGLEWAGDEWWAVAVQWHPEELDARTESGLFRAFTERAAALARV